MELLHAIIDFLVEITASMGYLGIFLLMALESSFFPFPSEVVMIPGGYLASLGEMNLVLVIFAGILGSLVGALFNYWLAYRFGRTLLLTMPGVRYFVTEERMKRVEEFFEKHGPISTFNGRLVPLIRQYISFPAGLAKMNLFQFSLYTSLGAGIWVAILAFIGYILGENEDVIHEYVSYFTVGALFFVLCLSLGYMIYKRRK